MKTLLPVILALLCFAACKKETTKPVDAAFDYYPGKAGTYWVYELDDLDSLGNVTHQGSPTDTVFITSDTVINGQEYKTFSKDVLYALPYTLHDSAGVLLDQYDFSITNSGSATTNDTFPHNYNGTNIPIMMIEVKHVYNNVSVNVPAGTFSTDQFRATPIYDLGYSHIPAAAYNGSSFAKGVGEITDRYFYQVNVYSISEYRLVSYHIVQ